MTTEVVKKEAQDLDVRQADPVGPDYLIQLAIDKGADIDKLEKLFDLKLRHDAAEAKKAFDQALVNFKKNPPTIVRDMVNKQYNSRYASLPNLAETLGKALGKYDLSATWRQKQEDGVIIVTCILSHINGHSEETTMSGPPDSSGQKNPLQQIKSTITYLRIATLESVTGIVASLEGNDDGNASSLSLEQIMQLMESAKSLAQLDVISKHAVALPEEEKKAARKLYTQRRKELQDG